MGRDLVRIRCKDEEEARELLNAYRTITRIRGFPVYGGYVVGNVVHLEIKD
jgi:hypothetical protein